MSLASIVNGLNTEFATSRAHVLAADSPLFADAIGSYADDATTFAALHDGASVGRAPDEERLERLIGLVASLHESWANAAMPGGSPAEPAAGMSA